MGKKHIVVKEKQFVYMSDPKFVSASQFCASARKIAPGRYSLAGSEATLYVIVYYEPSKRSKVNEAFKALGVDIEDYQQVVVDLESKDEEETFFMLGAAVNKYVCSLSMEQYQVTEGTEKSFPDGRSPRPSRRWCGRESVADFLFPVS